MKNIIIITSNAIRHNYFKVLFSQNKKINILRTYVEDNTSLDLQQKSVSGAELNDKLAQHFIARHNAEYDFFSDTIEMCKDDSNSKYIGEGGVNKNTVIDEIVALDPDLIVTYGCSIIKPTLIEIYKDRIVNVHLGLSPYYFGSGTNFHCLVNDEFQFEGYTFMYMDKGIDTGVIIHQSRAKFLPFDNPHQVGCRLIKKMSKDFINLIVNFEQVEIKTSIADYRGETYRDKDATEALTLKLYKIFDNNAVIRYLENQAELCKQYPIIEQFFLNSGDGEC